MMLNGDVCSGDCLGFNVKIDASLWVPVIMSYIFKTPLWPVCFGIKELCNGYSVGLKRMTDFLI